MSKCSRFRTALMRDESHGDRVIRAMEPLTGTDLGLPIEINLSPRVETALEAEITLNRLELQASGKVKSPKNKFHFSNYWEMELQSGKTQKYDLGRIKLAIKRNLLPNKYIVNKDSNTTWFLVFQGRLPRYGDFTLFVPVFNKNGEMIHNFRYDFEL